MVLKHFKTPFVTCCALFVYWSFVVMKDPVNIPKVKDLSDIVVSAPVLLLAYAGDRFLAANIEAMRAVSNMTTADTQGFRLRAHNAASLLNPCHEDNYWFGNTSLSWGGSVDQGFELLRHAAHCRYWDEWPAFFYAFNQNFFRQDIEEAQRVLEIAAQRSSANASAFRTYAIMLGLDRIGNTKRALTILQRERDRAKDKSLRQMLEYRVVRLEGLMTLLEAQALYENKTGEKLKDPQLLLTHGYLASIPNDPMKLGYEFRDNTFHLKQVHVQ